jgi:hypothetical protein
MRSETCLPPIGSLVRIQARGVESAYFALVVGHDQTEPSVKVSDPVVQVVCHEYEGMPYSVYASVMEVVGR